VLGANAHGQARTSVTANRADSRSVVMIGILEPRKNQAALLDAAEVLWNEGLAFSVTLAGRVNPHFGRPLIVRVRQLQRAGHPVVHATNLNDAAAYSLFARARFTVLPSLAEGFGLPVHESLWNGAPVLCSELPALAEAAAGGGCRLLPVNDTPALVAALRELLTSDEMVEELTRQALTRTLPTWSETARTVLAALSPIS
jgi:glycosyltransferase involved in cell wall biosynthesis